MDFKEASKKRVEKWKDSTIIYLMSIPLINMTETRSKEYVDSVGEQGHFYKATSFGFKHKVYADWKRIVDPDFEDVAIWCIKNGDTITKWDVEKFLGINPEMPSSYTKAEKAWEQLIQCGIVSKNSRYSEHSVMVDQDGLQSILERVQKNDCEVLQNEIQATFIDL